jgi:hypothetical protein
MFINYFVIESISIFTVFNVLIYIFSARENKKSKLKATFLNIDTEANFITWEGWILFSSKINYSLYNRKLWIKGLCSWIIKYRHMREINLSILNSLLKKQVSHISSRTHRRDDFVMFYLEMVWHIHLS